MIRRMLWAKPFFFARAAFDLILHDDGCLGWAPSDLGRLDVVDSHHHSVMRVPSRKMNDE